MMTRCKLSRKLDADTGYDMMLVDISSLLNAGRRAAARSVNTVMTATYWLVGRRIVEFEQGGKRRADYGEELLHHLSRDLTSKFGRGFGLTNLKQFRKFYLTCSISGIGRTSSDLSSLLAETMQRLPLSWSQYVRLMSVRDLHARRFYEEEALRGGWTVRQLDRQIDSQFYERTALSRNKAAMRRKGQTVMPDDVITAEEEIKDPYILEFLDLKDEYSESDLEEALIRRLEIFLMELGPEFSFIGKQRRLRLGNAWYRVDLLFFHRRLRCLVVIDLKLGEFSHADAGQMHLYLNYAKEHWTMPGENPPVGLILCTSNDAAVVHYALGNLPNKVMAAEYRTTLPNERVIAKEIHRMRRLLAGRRG